MNKQKYIYTTGEFAKLNNINKRTLHYYDEIGLFSPAKKGENGYRYYTCFQTVQLELILTLRNMGLSIEEILQYQKEPSGNSFQERLLEKKQLIDRSIENLLKIKSFLEEKSQKLALSLTASHGSIQELELPPQPILLSQPISGAYDDFDFAVAGDFSLRLKGIFGLYDNFGSRISAKNIQKGDFQHYDRYYSYSSQPWDEVRPGGRYLRTFSIGPWGRLEQVYQMLLSYAAEHGLRLTGYAYEEGLNELYLTSQEDYITMITVAVEPI